MGTFLRVVGGIALGLGAGVLVGAAVFIGRFSVGGSTIEPSQKARILGQSISEGMNVAALVVIVAVPVCVGVLLYRGRKRSK